MRLVDSSTRPLRLAVLTDSISHFEVPLFRLCAQTEELQFKVFYIRPVKAARFDAEYAQQIDWGYDLLSGYDSAQVADAKQLTLAAQEWQADVVMIYGYGWPGAPRLIFRNWLLGHGQIHRGTLSYYTDPRRSIKGRVLRPLGRMLLRLFHAHHYGGDYSRKVLLDAGIKESSLFFVPYSVDSQHFLAEAKKPDQHAAAADIRNSLGWESDAHVILFIAQLNWVKGPDIAMEVFLQVAKVDPQARFLVVGAGHMSDTMKATALRHLPPSAIHFAGFVPSAQTVPYYLASDLVLCTSRYETWARMVNEAMLCRRPCVISQMVAAAGGLVVDDQNGYVIRRPEASQFLQVIKRHFTLSTEQRRKMGDAAYQKAMTFAYEPHVANLVAAARYAHAHSRHARTGVRAT